ncbi:MAG: FAD-binding oxidoreductase [Dehalococcoidia bacterium]
MIRTADVVVIGGGCMGASTAYHLARRGVKDVALLEKGYLASGPTGKSSGIIRQHYPIKELVITSLKSLRVFERFDEMVGGDAGFVKTGFLVLVPEGHQEAVEGYVAMQKGLGVNVKLLSLDELKELQPQTNLEDVAVASYHPDSGYASTVATTNLFAARAREMGAHVYEGIEVKDIKLGGDGVERVVTDKGEISTPVVVNAAGAWGHKIGGMVGVELPVKPTRHQLCIFKRPYDFWQPQITYADFPLKCYFRPEGSDLFLAGALNEVFNHDKADPDKYDEEADPETLSWFLSRICQRFPAMKRASYRGGYSGIYDTTPDEQPIIGPVDEVRGFYCLLGWSGHGFKHCPAMGELMAELITEGETTEVNLSIFRPSRFAEKKLLKATAI